AKNDIADAEAIEPRPCHAEAMRFVPVKSEESQATLMLHKTRGLLVKQQTIDASTRLAQPSGGIRHYRRQRHWPRRRASRAGRKERDASFRRQGSREGSGGPN
ncbi:MAG: hypothetical protein ACRECZ_08605, partial [Methylocella sp.]